MATAKNGTKQTATPVEPVNTEPTHLSIKKLSDVYGLTKQQITTAVQSHAIFKEPGVVEKRVVEDTDIELKYISVDAFKRWMAQRDQAKATGITRTRSEGTRYTIVIKADQLEAVTKALATVNPELKLERAYKPGKKGEQDATPEAANPADEAQAVTANDQASVTDLFTAETVTA